MIGSLTGRLAQKNPSRLVVDVQGVGYEVQVPLSTFYGPGDVGADVALRIHTHVREDALSLFGFATALELDLFERLIGISGVGPRLALAVLSGIEPPDLVRAVSGGDVVRLTRIPGVGKKTAERIVLELKDRLPEMLVVETDSRETESETGGRARAAWGQSSASHRRCWTSTRHSRSLSPSESPVNAKGTSGRRGSPRSNIPSPSSSRNFTA